MKAEFLLVALTVPHDLLLRVRSFPVGGFGAHLGERRVEHVEMKLKVRKKNPELV